MYDIDIYSEHSPLRRPLAWSLGLHLAFAGFVVFYAVFVSGMRGTGWGSGHAPQRGERDPSRS